MSSLTSRLAAGLLALAGLVAVTTSHQAMAQSVPQVNLPRVALTAAKNGLTGAELTERLGIEEKSSDLLSLLENGTVIRENAASRNAADATTRMV